MDDARSAHDVQQHRTVISVPRWGVLRRTAEIASFLAEPHGRVLIGPGWLYYAAHAGLFGIVLFGEPGADAMDRLVRALKVELREGVPPHVSLVDASRLKGADLGAFEVLNRYVVEHREPLSRAVRRLALVRPGGLVGAMTAGFYEVLERPYPIGIFADADEAMAWLGEDPALLAELDALVREVEGSTPFVERLRAWLGDHLREAPLAEASRALGVSERTLQRRLRDAGTSFAAEHLAARLEAAKSRMRLTDAPLSTIALEAGFASQQHFSTAFRKAYGTPPSTWREG